MDLDRLHFTYEQHIRDLHHHLYGNANVRTPEGIASEVLKVIKTLMHERAAVDGTSAVGLSADLDLLRSPDQARPLAGDLRLAFRSMNDDLRAYPASTVIELDDPSLAAVFVFLAGFDFSRSGRDWLGDAIEIFRSITAKRIGGQFFTHSLVTDLAMTLLRYSPSDGDDLVDICAGSGGFLLSGAERIAGYRRGCEHNGIAPLGEPARRLTGLEVDSELTRLSNSNLAIKTAEVSEFVMTADSLAPPERWHPETRRRVIPDTHRCLASNPPFGSRLSVKDDQILQQFELARHWAKRDGRWVVADRERRQPRAPEVLFLERNLQLAEPGRGRVALVTPYQILSGPQAGYVREWLLRFTRILAVIDLPPTTFQPHTGTKASLLVYERRERPLAAWTGEDDYRIFMAVAEHIGHDRRGLPVFREGGDVIQTDIPAVACAYDAYLRGGDPSSEFEGAFTVAATELTNATDLRLNAAFHRPSTGGLKRSVRRLAERPGWKVTTVGEISERIFVPGRFKREYVANGDGVPFLGGTQISQFVPAQTKRLRRSDPHVEHCVVREGWVLITRSGSTGLVSSVPAPWDGWTVSDHIIRIVPDPGRLEPGYLEAYLRSAIGQELLSAGIFGSVIDEITPEYVASIPIAFPRDPALLTGITTAMGQAKAGRVAAYEGISGASAAIQSLVSAQMEIVGS